MRPGTGEAVRVALVALRDALAGAGVVASLSRTDLRTVPCAWVTPRALLATEGARLDGTVTVRCWVYLIVSPSGSDLEVVTRLGQLLDLALAAVQPDGDVETAAVPLSQFTDPAPAYRLPVDVPATPTE